MAQRGSVEENPKNTLEVYAVQAGLSPIAPATQATLARHAEAAIF